MANRILVVQTAFLGDLLLAIPLLKQIRKHWPEHKISLVCRSGLGAVLESLNVIDTAFEVKKGHGEDYENLISKLKSETFDYIFCPHQSLRSALLVRSLKSNKKIGFSKWWNALFFNIRVKKNMELPEALRQLQLLASQSSVINEEIFSFTKIFPKQKTERKIQKLTRLSQVPEFASTRVDLHKIDSSLLDKYQVPKFFIGIFPGSVWPTKQWTEEGFLQLTKILLQQKFSVVLFGSKDEFELCRRICAGAGEELAANNSHRVINLAGRTNLVETLQILRQARLAVSNDSGGQHLAAVCGIPTVSIFGPTILEQGFRPWNSQAVVVQEFLDCRPCGKHGHKKCPIGTHECMKNISAQQVHLAIQDLITEANP